MVEFNSYELSRNWFNWCFENPEKINANHTALYFFIIEHCNRLGWKEKFGLPMEMAKDALGIKNYKTYSKAFNDLVEFGFIKVIEKSKNQYSANIIALVKNTKAHTKALSKATLKHNQKQVHDIVCIDKPINLLTNEPINMEILFRDLPNSSYVISIAQNNKVSVDRIKSLIPIFKTKAELSYPSQRDFITHFKNWIPNNLSLSTEVDLSTLSKEEYILERKRQRDEYDRKTTMDNLAK